MYISALGKGTLMINSQRGAVDFLEKRSNIYSDSPRFISAGDFLTKNLSFGHTPYGDLYAICYYILSIHTDDPNIDCAAIATEAFSKLAMKHFHPIQDREAVMLALALIKRLTSMRESWLNALLIFTSHLPHVCDRSSHRSCPVGTSPHCFLRLTVTIIRYSIACA